MKTVPLSVRISQEDAEFLAKLKSGGVTPSDKVRTVIADARRHAEKQADFRGCLELLREQAAPAAAAVRDAELREKMHSDLVTYLLEWLPEAFAYLLTAARAVPEAKPAAAALSDLELGLLDRSVHLVEAVLRMGVTPRSPTYDRGAVAERLGPVLELARVVLSLQQQGGSRNEQ